MTILEILNYLNETNSTNDKLKKLKQFKDNELFKRVLAMTYDKATYTYGVTMKNVEYLQVNEKHDLTYFLDYLENSLCTREDTGNLAISTVGQIMSRLSTDDAKVAELILGRDLKINVGRTNINKVFKNLIVKPAYMRCGVYTQKTSQKIPQPALIQLKADGTYREMLVQDGKVEFVSRSGENYQYPVIAQQGTDLEDGYYFGELTVRGISDRSEANGLINSDNPPHDDIIFSVWDYVSIDEYSRAKNKEKTHIFYGDRFLHLKEMLSEHELDNIEVIESYLVESLPEAIERCSGFMSKGLEGAVLKSQRGLFKDGTSNDQLKMKLQIEADVRIVGFKDGSKGTKREGKIGSIQFATDDGKVKGYASGFTDDVLDEMSENPDKYIGLVFELQFNDITKGRNNDHYALSHPRFVEFRNDKTETDDLERILIMREMSKLLENVGRDKNTPLTISTSKMNEVKKRIETDGVESLFKSNIEQFETKEIDDL